MTNVPGPRLPINFCGRTVEACHFSLAPQKNGFLVSILSYKNNLHISIAGNKMIVGENGAKELIQFIKEEL